MTDPPESTEEELTVDQARALFDRVARETFDVSRLEFLRLYYTGELPSEWDHDKLARLEILLPFAR